MLSTTKLRRAFLAASALELSPPASEMVIASFEAEHAIRLPDDYRQFVAEVADGILVDGEPTLFSLADITLLLERQGATPSRDYPYTRDDAHRLRRAMAAMPAAGWSSNEELMALQKPGACDGCLPLTDHGCGESCVLVVAGSERGYMWRTGPFDAPEGIGFYSPQAASEWRPLRFGDWLPYWAGQFLGISI